MSCEYLIQVWIAEGFVNPKETQDPYDLGRFYLNELSDRCMIEFVPYNGNEDVIKYCKMHDLLHELALSESQNQPGCLFQAGKNLTRIPVEKCHGLRRISLIKNDITIVDQTIRSPGLRTLLPWNNLHLNSICAQFFSKMRHLCVLDLSQTWIKSLPKSIAMLIRLRLLNLSRTAIEKLPKCLSALRSLQFLDVSWCEKLTSLHSGIGEHQFMLHLNIAGCKQLGLVPQGISKLLSLRILGQVVFKCGDQNAGNALQLKHLKDLTLLQQLSIVISGRHSNSQGIISENIFGGMTEMRKLLFENCDAADSLLPLPDDIKFMRRLEILHLHNCVLPEWISHLQNLMVLLLKGDSIANYKELHKIPNLGRLVLLQNKECIEFPAEFWSHMSFPKLETLIIEDFDSVERFPSIEEDAMPMPMLKYLRLANCSQLEEIPRGLKLRLKSLEKLEVIGCSNCQNDLPLLPANIQTQ